MPTRGPRKQSTKWDIPPCSSPTRGCVRLRIGKTFPKGSSRHGKRGAAQCQATRRLRNASFAPTTGASQILQRPTNRMCMPTLWRNGTLYGAVWKGTESNSPGQSLFRGVPARVSPRSCLGPLFCGRCGPHKPVFQRIDTILLHPYCKRTGAARAVKGKNRVASAEIPVAPNADHGIAVHMPQYAGKPRMRREVEHTVPAGPENAGNAVEIAYVGAQKCVGFGDPEHGS